MSVYRAAISGVFVLALVLKAGAMAQSVPDGKKPAALPTVVVPPPPETRPRADRYIETLKTKLPYQSLAGRLTYEKSLGVITPPHLTKPGEGLLQEIDTPKDENRSRLQATGEGRARLLRLLHSGNVDEFSRQEGFGLRRFPLPGTAFLFVYESAAVPFDKAPPLSAEYNAGQSESLPQDGEAETTGNPWRLPTRAKLVDFHLDSQFGFVAPEVLGDVHDVDRVAGFMTHGIRNRLYPPVNEAVKWPEPLGAFLPPPRRWRVVRLELVSLLKHPTPVVYVSDHLPRMDELAAAKTRPLTGFEAESLAKLQTGEDVVEHSTANVIDLVGSVRAAKKCISCHNVPYGTLLGAFSYQLQRDPPIKDPLAN